MKKIAAVILLWALTGCSLMQQYDNVKLWAGIQVPIPLYPVNIGLKLDLQNDEAVARELEQRAILIDAYADFALWKKTKLEKERLDEEVSNSTDNADFFDWLWSPKPD